MIRDGCRSAPFGWAVTLALLAGLPAWAAGTAEDCTAIDSPEARLACYDRMHGRADGPGPVPQTVRPRPADPPSDTTAGEALDHTGQEPGEQPAARPDRAPSAAANSEPEVAGKPPGMAEFGAEHLEKPEPADRERQDLEARVVATGESLGGRHWFRLDNGQLWEQVTVRRTDIESGDTVRLNRSPIGTYHLRRADGSSRSSQVRRRE